MTQAELQKHMLATYFSLRRGLAILAFAFPLLLFGIGRVCYGIPLQGSMSDYYFAFDPTNSPWRAFPMRGWFVGILWALGCFLYLYKGFSKTENITLNVAGACAVAVALIHMPTPGYCTYCGSDTIAFLHYWFAKLFFFCIGFVAFACIDQTLSELDEARQRKFRRIYFTLAGLMFILPGLAWVLHYFHKFSSLVFVAETLGVWVFAIYWLVKSHELELSGVERRALLGKWSPKPLGKDASLRMRAGMMFD